MYIPKEDARPCVACGDPIVFARENKTRAGKPKEVAMDPVPDPNGKWVMSLSGDRYYAGKVGYNQHAGMAAAGHEFHTSHNETCTKKDEYIRLRRGKWNG